MKWLLKLLKIGLPISRSSVYLFLAFAVVFYILYLQSQLTAELRQRLEDRQQELESTISSYEARVQAFQKLDAERAEKLALLEAKKSKVITVIKTLDSDPEAKEWKDVKIPDSVIVGIADIHSSLRKTAPDNQN